MSEHDVRLLGESQYRDAHKLFMGSLNNPGVSDEAWQGLKETYEQGRCWGAFLDGELSGTTKSNASAIAVPGGAMLPAAAVTGVGVRADRTRRGVLTALMRTQLDAIRQRGELIAMLHASETEIYGRFGYGMATRMRNVRLDTHRARLRPEAPGGGSVRLLDLADARKVLPEVYERLNLSRPGMISRGPSWWTAVIGRNETSGDHVVVAVHSDDDGVDDGFVKWQVKDNDHLFGDGITTLQVLDLQAGDATTAASLWRFVLGIDLADVVAATMRPVDEPLEWWLTDRRQCQVRSVDDDLWIRLVDVPEALAARGYGDAEPIVVEVRDSLLTENTGRYRISPMGVQRCEDAADISMDVDMLGALYLGDVAPSTLAAANRIAVHEPDALPAADRLFATTQPPWCGTSF